MTLTFTNGTETTVGNSVYEFDDFDIVNENGTTKLTLKPTGQATKNGIDIKYQGQTQVETASDTTAIQFENAKVTIDGAGAITLTPFIPFINALNTIDRKEASAIFVEAPLCISTNKAYDCPR